jgi:DNA-binding PadR family transcriptional regulator
MINKSRSIGYLIINSFYLNTNKQEFITASEIKKRLERHFEIYLTIQAVYYHLKKLKKNDLILIKETRKKYLNKNRPFNLYSVTRKNQLKYKQLNP